MTATWKPILLKSPSGLEDFIQAATRLASEGFIVNLSCGRDNRWRGVYADPAEPTRGDYAAVLGCPHCQRTTLMPIDQLRNILEQYERIVNDET